MDSPLNISFEQVLHFRFESADFVRQSGNISEEWNVAFNNYLRKQGYDAIELSETGYTIVFDKEQVVTIGNESVK